MDLNFAHPLWFLLLLAIPLVWGLYFFYYQREKPLHQLEKFIDKHLIPYLLLGGGHKKKNTWIPLIAWSLVWSCFVLALAGPRWNFKDVETFTQNQNLVILLDLSESMNAKDIAPSRLVRAKQKIEDLLSSSTGVTVGLVAFAADPHMIAPMTEDKQTLRHLLPSLDTDLVYVQGSKLAPALDMAAAMLKNEPGHSKAIVVISDGGYEDSSALHTAKKIAETGIKIYAIGVGTTDGAPLKNLRKNGSSIISKLERDKFRELSRMGNGRYFDADHSEPLTSIFNELAKRRDIENRAHKTYRLWEERYYLFLLPAIPLFLWWYRKGSLFIIFFLPALSQASLFYNAEQEANLSYEKGDYAHATFQDPYRQGVAAYRKGDYKTAEEMFRQSARPEVRKNAAYNLGNSLVFQNKLKDAITAYEDVLKEWPDHTRAKENLELVKRMLEQQEQDQKEQQDQNNDQQQDQSKDKSEQDQQQGDDKKEQGQNKDSGDKSEKDRQQDQQQGDDRKERDQSKDSKDKSEKNQEGDQQDQKQQGQLEPKSDQKEKIDAPEKQSGEGLPGPQEKAGQPAPPRSQEDLDADLWLDQIKNDPKPFLKNKFYLESKKNGTKEDVDPW